MGGRLCDQEVTVRGWFGLNPSEATYLNVPYLTKKGMINTQLDSRIRNSCFFLELFASLFPPLQCPVGKEVLLVSCH